MRQCVGVYKGRRHSRAAVYGRRHSRAAVYVVSGHRGGLGNEEAQGYEGSVDVDG